MRHSGKQRSRFGIVAILFVLIVGSAARTDTPVSFSPNTRVVSFPSANGQWILTTFAQVKPGSEIYFNNHLYRVSGPDKALVVPTFDAAKLFEADRPYDQTSRRPRPGDVVQALDKDLRPLAHTVPQPGLTIRFQGKVYSVSADGSLVDKGFATASALQHIEITKSASQHIMDRHTVGGTQNAGASIFYPGENIQALIKDAELMTPVLEANGYVKREFDAGRAIGFEGKKQTSTYRVIATQSGKLVTAYPIVQ